VNELSVIQQGGERSKANTIQGGRQKGVISPLGFDEIVSVEGEEAFKGKACRAHDLRSLEKPNNFLEGRAITASPGKSWVHGLCLPSSATTA
jgi:hypothetical protein